MSERKISAEVNGRKVTFTADIEDGASPEDIHAAVSAYAEANPKQFEGPPPSALKAFQDRAMGAIGQNMSGMASAFMNPKRTLNAEGDRISGLVHDAEYDFNHGNYGQSLWNAVKSTPLVGGTIEQTAGRVNRGEWPELVGDVMTGAGMGAVTRPIPGIMKKTPRVAGTGIRAAIDAPFSARPGAVGTAVGALAGHGSLEGAVIGAGVGEATSRILAGTKAAYKEAKAITRENALKEKILESNKVRPGMQSGRMAEAEALAKKAKADEAVALSRKRGAELAKTLTDPKETARAGAKLTQRVNAAEAKTVAAKETMATAAHEKSTARAGSQADRVAEAAEKAKAAAKAEADALAKKQGFELAQAAEKQVAAKTAEAKMQSRLEVAAEKEAGAVKELSTTEAARLARQAERQAKVQATLAP